MTEQPFDFQRLEEIISVVEHDSRWAHWYKVEVEAIQKVLGVLHVEFAHVGSSAVPGLMSKPIIDIMMGLRLMELPQDAQRAISSLGYEYFGRLHANQERLFARKRGDQSFNLQIVPVGGKEWHEKILFRDYLRAHPAEVALYSRIKVEAVTAGKTRLLEYHRHKDAVVAGILERALRVC